MKRRAQPQKLPGLTLIETRKLLHAAGKIDDLETPNLHARVLLLEVRGILRGLQRRARSRKKSFDHMIGALETIDCTLTELAEGGVS